MDMTTPQISSPTSNCSPMTAIQISSQYFDAIPLRRRKIHLPPFLFESSCNNIDLRKCFCLSCFKCGLFQLPPKSVECLSWTSGNRSDQWDHLVELDVRRSSKIALPTKSWGLLVSSQQDVTDWNEGWLINRIDTISYRSKGASLLEITSVALRRRLLSTCTSREPQRVLVFEWMMVLGNFNVLQHVMFRRTWSCTK